MKKIFLLCLLSTLMLSGCGNGSSGTLSVSTLTANNGIVTATAKFTPASGTTMQGLDITFKWYTVGVTSGVQSTVTQGTSETNPSGAATGQFILSPGRTESMKVYVAASTDGLMNIEGWQSVTVEP